MEEEPEQESPLERSAGVRVHLARCAGSELVLHEVALRVLTTPTPDPASQTLSRHTQSQ